MAGTGPDPAVQARFQRALERFAAKAERDANAVAVILLGSLAHDVVWEKSDIDLLVVIDEVKPKEGLTLVEEGVSIHASIQRRSAFKKALEGSLQSSFLHSLLSKGRMVWCRDEALAALFEERRHLGAHDRQVQLLHAGCAVMGALAKAEKWFYVRGDLHYSFVWIMATIQSLAAIETLLAGEITEREVLDQALRHNPTFFGRVYSALIDGDKTEETIGAALDAIETYLRERSDALFGPVLRHLAECGGPRSLTEIDHHFTREMGLEGVEPACEYLAQEGRILKLGLPVRLTEKSRVDLQEAAYLFEGEPPR